MDKVLQQVLKRVTPTPEEKAKAEAMIARVREAADKAGKQFGVSSILAGSHTRGTFMPDKREFDVFMMFPEDTPRKTLERQGVALGKKIVKSLKGKHQIAYAEHPYVRSKIGDYAVDFVPCYKIKSAANIKSAVDRTPFHNRWLQKAFKPGLSDEVRLLKQFSKGIGVYGSDTRVLGLSGYLCELLTIHYGSFRNFLDAASKWEAGQVFIDIERHHHVPEAIMPRFRGNPLIVIDPVDPNRNVAAALSPANFEKLAYSSRMLLQKPSLSFFFREPRKLTAAMLGKEARKRGTFFLGVKFSQPQVIQDILWPQLRRAARRLRDILEEYEFHVIGYDVWSDAELTKGGACLLLLEMEVWQLPNIQRVVGPMTHVRKHSEEFIKKYNPRGRMLVDDDGRWIAEIHRKWRSAEDKLRDSLSDKLPVLKEKGIPSYVAQAVAKGHELLDLKGVLRLAGNKPAVAAFMADYLEREVL